MARRPTGPRHGMQNAIYVVAGLIVIVVIGVIFGLNPFGKNKKASPPDTNDLKIPEANAPNVNDKGFTQPKQIVQEEPNLGSPRVEPKPDIEANPAAEELIAQAATLIGVTPSRIIEARDKLSEALKLPMSPQQRSLVKTRLSQLADQWLFSKTFFAQDRLCSSYKVEQGDRLSNIGKQFNVPYELLMEINKIPRPEALREGGTIKVVNGPFNVKVYLSTFTMDIFLQDTFVRSFPVGLGQPGRQTPVGLWHVKAGGKIPNALYTDPDTGKVIHPEDTDYPLGSRWIELEGLDENTKDKTGFGIHGTKDPQSIGRASSRGCIRLHNGDVIKVYNMLVPVNSLVKVTE